MKIPPTDGQLLLSGYTHHPAHGPCWQVNTLTTTPTQRYIFPVWNRVLRLQLLAVRYCIGRYDLATQQHTPCPRRRQVKSPYQNCYPCFKATGFNPAFYNVPRSQLSPWQQAYNQQPHCTYLAYWGSGVVKVGIALQTSIQQRWLAQGARAAMILQAAEDAYQARTLEVQVSKPLHLPERITGAQKKQWLNIPHRFEQAALGLVQYQQAIAQALALHEVSHTVQDLQPYYFPAPPSHPIVDVDQKQQAVAGRVLGMVGELVVYEAGGCFWMCALKKYLGSAYVRLSAVPTATQASFSFAQPV